MLNEPRFILFGANGALNPTWRDVVDSYTLLPAVASCSSHETSQSVFCCSVFPITLGIPLLYGTESVNDIELTGESIHATMLPVIIKQRSRSATSGCLRK